MGAKGALTSWTSDEGYQFEKQLPAILNFVQDVRVALGEDVISADIEIAVIEPGTPFNSKSMKNNNDDGRNGSIPPPSCLYVHRTSEIMMHIYAYPGVSKKN